jgi:hypothetical protein
VDAVWSIFVVGLLTETVVYFAAPQVYALTARLPFGPSRRIVVHPRALERLRAPVAERAAGYRESAIGSVDLRRLELPERLEIDGLVLHFHLDRGMAIARLPYTWAKRMYGMLRVDVVVVDNALELHPRFVIMSWPSLIGLGPLAVIAIVATTRASHWPSTFVAGALFVGINVVLGLLLGKPRLESGLGEIERQIEAALASAETAD